MNQMITFSSLKKFNYINETLGFTMTYTALMELNELYTKYHLNPTISKNIALWDWHCGHNEASKLNEHNIIVIAKLSYLQRSQDLKTNRRINDMNEADVFDINVTHRCGGCIEEIERTNTKNNTAMLQIPYSKQCAIRKKQDANVNGIHIDASIIFNQEQHPMNNITHQSLKICGFLFCFKMSFDLFLTKYASKFNVDLSLIEDWKSYKSNVNPLWKQRAMYTIKTSYKRNNKKRNIKQCSSDDIETQTVVTKKMKLNEHHIETNTLSNNTLNPNLNSVYTGRCINPILEIEHQTIVDIAELPPYKLGKVKTESIIVNCFRKELLPFLDCSLQNKEVKNAVQKICNKYFFRMDQVRKHKEVLQKMRKQNKLSFYKNIILPETKDYDINKVNKEKRNGLTITPKQIVKDWMLSHQEKPLHPPFSGNDLLSYVRDDNK